MANYQPFRGGNQPPAVSSATVPKPVVLNNTVSAQVQNNGSSQANRGYRATAGLVTGSLQIVCGCFSMVMAMAVMYIVSLNYATGYYDDSEYGVAVVTFFAYGAWPFWAGLFFLVTGITGVKTSNKTNGVIIAYMVLAIISALIAAGQVVWEALGAVTASYCTEGYYSSKYVYTCEIQVDLVVCHSLASFIGLTEMIVAIVGAAFCCHGVCCGQNGNIQSATSQMVLVPVQQFSSQAMPNSRVV